MRTLRHRKQYHVIQGHEHKLFTLSFMVLFFIIFDGIIMYLAPIVMQRSGIQLGMIGVIIGLSSVAGMLFDVLLLRLLEKTSYQKIFFYMFLAAAAVPLFLLGATTITIYLAAMAMWGLYYNLYDVGILDFIGRTTVSQQHTSSFGVLKVFEGLGYLVAPSIASFALVMLSQSKVFPWWVYSFLVLAFVCYLFLCFSTISRGQNVKPERQNVYSLLIEVGIWKKVGRILFPILLLTLTINLVDAAIWTIGPLFSESLAISSGISGGALMLAYTLPPLLVGWFIGRFVTRFGKKNTALVALLIGSLLLILVGLVMVKLLIIAIIFCISLCFSFVWPTINAAYADDILDASEYHEAIETIDDCFTNLGDTVGPIVGGYAAQFFGLTNAFMAIGILGTIVALLLFRYTPNNLVSPIVKQ